MVKHYNITNLLSDASIRDINEIVKITKLVKGKKYLIRKVDLEVVTYDKEKKEKYSLAQILAKANDPNFYNFIAVYYGKPFEHTNAKYQKLIDLAVRKLDSWRHPSQQHTQDFIEFVKAKARKRNKKLAYEFGLLLNTTWLPNFSMYINHIFKEKAPRVKVMLLKYQLTRKYDKERDYKSE